MSLVRRTAAVLLAGAAVTGAVALASAPSAAHEKGRSAHAAHQSDAHSRDGAGAALAKARKDLSRFKDVDVALAAGYVPVSGCESTPEGGMGVHYLNGAYVGQTDPAKPAILLYEPQSEGKPVLVGAEWFQPDADQDLTTDGDRPSLLGRPFDGPMAGHSPQMPVHYDLHVWLFRANPDGIFKAWNPHVTC